MNWSAIASLSGLLAVGFGAFGAHVVKPRLSPTLFEAYATGSDYHLSHSIALLALALYSKSAGRSLGFAPLAMSAGILLFSGSLYALALTGVRIFGAVTPVGGSLLLVGWGISAWKLSRSN